MVVKCLRNLFTAVLKRLIGALNRNVQQWHRLGNILNIINRAHEAVNTMVKPCLGKLRTIS
jgi:hypothetical protein